METLVSNFFNAKWYTIEVGIVLAKVFLFFEQNVRQFFNSQFDIYIGSYRNLDKTSIAV